MGAIPAGTLASDQASVGFSLPTPTGTRFAKTAQKGAVRNTWQRLILVLTTQELTVGDSEVMSRAQSSTPALVDTGIDGLDHILNGGLVSHRMYLVEGDPGSGKTTLALQFLLAGVRLGESCLFVTLSES